MALTLGTKLYRLLSIKQTALIQRCTVSCQSYDQGGAQALADSGEKNKSLTLLLSFGPKAHEHNTKLFLC